TDAVIAACGRKGIRIVFDLDDDLLAVPRDKDPEGTYAASRDSLIKLMRAAQCVTASTETLAKSLQNYSARVSILPNLISDRLWFGPVEPVESLPNEIAGSRDREIRIVYMGGFTHGEDLALLRAPMTELMRSNPLVRFFVIGGERQARGWYTSLPIPHDRKAYPRFVPWLRAIFAQMDFAVAPLVDDSFNSAKSDVKFLEYSAGGLAGIYSDVVSYRGIVAASGAGLLTANDEKAWFKALQVFVADRDRTSRIGRMARSWVQEHKTLRTGLDEFDAMLRAVVNIEQEGSM
ncbi:MAG TPA: glycosyltransferase, partial [Blastocatellia bacterium]|nr:glycosyltransferase [Blastocatellia bacterium]